MMTVDHLLKQLSTCRVGFVTCHVGNSTSRVTIYTAPEASAKTQTGSKRRYNRYKKEIL
ncbi:MAG: hypothetical protein GY940_22025 [bacterium]|nr:hypothetical protein [bacterium]